MNGKLFINYTYKWWMLITVLLVLLFTLIGVFFNAISYSFIGLFSLLGLSVGLLLRSIDLQTDRIKSRVQEAEMELQAVGGLYQSVETQLPLNLGDWAISAHFLNRLIKEICLREPKLVVECGSGTSTIVISSCLQDIGEGTVISLDHLEKYASKTRNLLEIEGLKEWANVVTAPLQEYELDKGDFQWYGDSFKNNINGKIDLLIVDGPPAPLQELSRYPAISLLKDYLADDCLIMLDDTNRVEEKKIAKIWATMLEADIEFNDNCKGYAIIQK